MSERRDESRHRTRLLCWSLLTALLIPAAVFAHPLHQAQGGLLAGWMHPLGGFDHAAAAVLVGLWSAQRGGRARWLAPALFVATMLIGSSVAVVGDVARSIEPFIAITVIALGVLVAARIAVRRGLSWKGAGALIAACALVHGYVHGSELPVDVARPAFMVGFAFATIVLHLAGVLLAAAALSRGYPLFVRAIGGCAAFAGALLVTI